MSYLVSTRSGVGRAVDPGRDEGMKAILGPFILDIFLKLGLIAFGLGVGFLLHRLLPSVDLGTGILIGVVATGFSIHSLIRLMIFVEFLDFTRDEDDNLPPIRVYPLGSPRSGRKRKRKSSQGLIATGGSCCHVFRCTGARSILDRATSGSPGDR
jgi:hypothetical protein